MRTLWVVSKLHCLVWWRSLRDNAVSALISLGSVILLGVLAYSEVWPRVNSGGFQTLAQVYRLALLGIFLAFALLDSSYFQKKTLRGFPVWVPLTHQQVQTGLFLPAVVLVASVTTLLATLITYRAGLSGVTLVLFPVFMLANSLATGFIGQLCGNFSTRMIPRALGFRPSVQLPIRIVLLAGVSAVYGGYLYAPAIGLGQWLKPEVALARWALQVGEYSWLNAILATLFLVAVSGALSLYGYGQDVPGCVSSVVRVRRSISFPTNKTLAVALLEGLRLYRDWSMVRYLITGGLIALLLVTGVGRGLLPLEHGSSFLALVLYMVTFLMAAIPLRSKGMDLPNQWLWSSIPFHVGSYTLGKFFVAVGVPTVLLAGFLGISALLEGITLSSGVEEIVQVMRFGWVAYSVAFAWGFSQPHRDGDLTSEISQAGGYSVGAFVLFRILDSLTPLLTGGLWVLVLLVSVSACGFTVKLEDRLRNG